MDSQKSYAILLYYTTIYILSDYFIHVGILLLYNNGELWLVMQIAHILYYSDSLIGEYNIIITISGTKYRIGFYYMIIKLDIFQRILHTDFVLYCIYL